MLGDAIRVARFKEFHFMMINDNTLKQLLRINDALFQLCKSLTDKRDIETSSRLIPTRGRSYRLYDISWQEQIVVMQPY